MAAKGKKGLSSTKVREVTSKVKQEIVVINENIAKFEKEIQIMEQSVWTGGKRSQKWYNAARNNIKNNRLVSTKLSNLNNAIESSVAQSSSLW